MSRWRSAGASGGTRPPWCSPGRWSTGGLFAGNAAITGEFNYQGGDRKTFYSFTGFPFANDRETFENIGPSGRREAVLLGDVLVNRHTLTVFRHNLVYFVVGRFSGLGAVLLSRRREPAAVSRRRRGASRGNGSSGRRSSVAALVLLLLTPFTYSGGGGPVGNRYFLSFYPLFLFLTPALARPRTVRSSRSRSARCSRRRLSCNPFYSSFNPGEHAKSGPLRWLPIELTLLNDLPMAAHPDRSKRLLGGTPPVLAYFPGRQRIRSRRRRVLGEGEVADGSDSPGAGRADAATGGS